MERMGFVMRKATKTAKKLPPNLEELKESYDIFDGTENMIAADLIVNSGQTLTGVRMVPVMNDWTMTTRGSKQVTVIVLGDKRDTFLAFPFLNWLIAKKLHQCVVQKLLLYKFRNNRLHCLGLQPNRPYFRHGIKSRENIFTGRYFRWKIFSRKIFSREDIFA